MHPIRLLSGAGIKSLSIGNSSGCSSSTSLISSSDAAHCLSGLSPMITPFAFWRFCGDEGQLKKVRGNLAVKAIRISKKHGFKIKNTTLAGLGDAALAQLVQPLCSRCEGLPCRRVKNKVVVCKSCMGKGKRTLSTRKVCEAAGISHKAYTSNHATVFEELLTLLSGWESSVVNHVRDRMGF